MTRLEQHEKNRKPVRKARWLKGQQQERQQNKNINSWLASFLFFFMVSKLHQSNVLDNNDHRVVNPINTDRSLNESLYFVIVATNKEIETTFSSCRSI